MADNLDFDKIRSESDIVSVISNYLTIIHKGKNHVAVCPFHNDTNPSLSISSEKQIYKCFVCNAGGNVFNFVQNYEKISFIGAVVKVAELSNIELPQNLKKIKPVDQVTSKLKEIIKVANDFYTYNLQSSSDGSEIWQYLKSRGITREIAKEFNLGYAPNSFNNLTLYLLNKKYTEGELLDAGIVYSSNDEIKDRFRNRLLFAITDEMGDVVGFSGRALEKNDEPKYINSPESKVFKKNQLLYNYSIAKNHYRKDERIYIVEGFMDTIGLSKIGIKNVVATMGTALTTEHFKLLKKLNTKIVMALDTDSAGQIATVKILDSSKNFGLNIAVVDSDIDLDADEILEKSGEEELRKYLEHTISPIEFYFKIFLKRYNVENYQDKKVVIKELSKRIAMLDIIDQEYYSKKLAKSTGISWETIQENIIDLKVEEPKYIKEEIKIRNNFNRKNRFEKEDKFDIMQKQLIYYMLYNNEASEIMFRKSLTFPNDKLRILYTYITDYYEKNKNVSLADIITYLPDQELVELITRIYDSDDNLMKEFNLSYLENYINLTKINGEILEVDTKMKEISQEDKINSLELAKLFERRSKLREDWDSIIKKTN